MNDVAFHPRVLVFDPYYGGHHAEHIHHLLHTWKAYEFYGHIHAVVAAPLLDQSPQLEPYLLSAGNAPATLSVSPQFDALSNGNQSLWQLGLAHRRLLFELAHKWKPKHLLIMYFDHAQFALATALSVPKTTKIGGLLFRPTLHLEAASKSINSHLTHLRKLLLLRQALRHPAMHALFCLDPLAIEPLQRLAPRLPIHFLPEPLDQRDPQTPTLIFRERLGIDPHRHVALLFGALDDRKGVIPLLDALTLLPPEDQRQWAIVLAGRLDSALQFMVQKRVAALTESTPLQVHLDLGFLPEERLNDHIHAADLVLLPYQHHVGSSGVLVRAAAASKPVIGPNTGLLHHLIKKHSLGQTIDVTQPKALAAALRTYLTTPTAGFDLPSVRAYAQAQTSEAYSLTLLTKLLGAER